MCSQRKAEWRDEQEYTLIGLIACLRNPNSDSTRWRRILQKDQRQQTATEKGD